MDHFTLHYKSIILYEWDLKKKWKIGYEIDEK